MRAHVYTLHIPLGGLLNLSHDPSWYIQFFMVASTCSETDVCDKFNRVLWIWNTFMLKYIRYTIWTERERYKFHCECFMHNSGNWHYLELRVRKHRTYIVVQVHIINYWINRNAFGFCKPTPFRFNGKSHKKNRRRTLEQLSEMQNSQLKYLSRFVHIKASNILWFRFFSFSTKNEMKFQICGIQFTWISHQF